MVDRIAFSVGGRPIGKGRPRTTARVVFQNGKPLAVVTIHTPAETRKAEKVVREAARSAMAGRAPFTGPVRLTVVAIFEPPASWPKVIRAAALRGEVYHTSVPDADNIEKLICDGLNPEKKGAPFCLMDDSQAAEVIIRKRYGRPERVDVEVRALGSPNPDVPTAPPSPAEKRRQQALAGKPAAKVVPTMPRLL